MLQRTRYDSDTEYDIKMSPNGIFSIYMENDANRDGYTQIKFFSDRTCMHSMYDPDLDIPGGDVRLFQSAKELTAYLRFTSTLT